MIRGFAVDTVELQKNIGRHGLLSCMTPNGVVSSQDPLSLLNGWQLGYQPETGS
jgi:hypothetical protein